MRITPLLIGVLLGGVIGFGLDRYLTQMPAKSDTPGSSDTITVTAAWDWPDSLDAVNKAPQSHHIVYEDSTVRILQVLLEPGKTEPVHTHQWNSVMWFAQAVPMTYYQYALKNNQYEITDSFPIPQMPGEALNHGDLMKPEGPHAIKNQGAQQGIAYRVEFKKP